MVARRLADESVQPAHFAFNKDNAKWAEWKIGLYPAGRQQSAVIPLLMRAQDQDGWISRATIETIATMLGMAYIRVLEVATFYTQFQLQPVGSRAHIQVCGTTPCMLRGAEELIDVCKSKIHQDPHHLSADGTLSWEEVECMGTCVNAPMVAIYHDTYEDLTAERFGEIVDAFQAGKGASVKTGPQIDRLFSAAAGGATTLLQKPTAKREKFVAPAPAPAPAPVAVQATPVAAVVAAVVTAPAKAKSPAKAAPASKDSKPAEAIAAKAAIAPKAGAAAKPAAKPAPKAGGAAETLFATPKGKADDLKMISGVGPVLEGRLNSLGITKFSQVAAFSTDDIAKVEDSLSFKGRITRDDWLKQADALARGGEAEYIRVFGKKPR